MSSLSLSLFLYLSLSLSVSHAPFRGSTKGWKMSSKSESSVLFCYCNCCLTLVFIAIFHVSINTKPLKLSVFYRPTWKHCCLFIIISQQIYFILYTQRIASMTTLVVIVITYTSKIHRLSTRSPWIYKLDTFSHEYGRCSSLSHASAVFGREPVLSSCHAICNKLWVLHAQIFHSSQI